MMPFYESVCVTLWSISFFLQSTGRERRATQCNHLLSRQSSCDEICLCTSTISHSSPTLQSRTKFTTPEPTERERWCVYFKWPLDTGTALKKSLHGLGHPVSSSSRKVERYWNVFTSVASRMSWNEIGSPDLLNKVQMKLCVLDSLFFYFSTQLTDLSNGGLIHMIHHPAIDILGWFYCPHIRYLTTHTRIAIITVINSFNKTCHL
jgi:hypothetical protein